MEKTTYKKYSLENQKLLAGWAADCAERVLPFFEKSHPGDDRPKNAIMECRNWIRTGVFKMAVIRGASLSSHAAARDARSDEAALFAARAAGQAVATAHVPQHAYGGAYYALKAIAAANPIYAEEKVTAERTWQIEHLPEHLREIIMKRLIIDKKAGKIVIKIIKGKGF